ncbi:Zinc finger LIM-type [Trinorchestia longiramus]|nr:Zinc finger LIM-type [Trinorchestia longiramus]
MTNLYPDDYLVMTNLHTDDYLVMTNLYSDDYLLMTNLYSDDYLLMTNLYSDDYLVMNNLNPDDYLVMTNLHPDDYLIYDYMSGLPGHKVPRISTPGEKYRERQLMLQLPKQDLALAYTRHVEPLHHTSYKDFVTARNDISLDIAIVKHRIPYEANCRSCSMKMPEGSTVVVAPRLGDYVAWHPACFTCGTCNELLVDLVYCVWEDGVHCGRHYAEKLKPRCSACDEVSGVLRVMRRQLQQSYRASRLDSAAQAPADTSLLKPRECRAPPRLWSLIPAYKLK